MPSVNNNVDIRSRFPYDAAMTRKDAIGIRFAPDERDALEAASDADQRPISAMGRKIIVEWLKREGWLRDADHSNDPAVVREAKAHGAKP